MKNSHLLKILLSITLFISFNEISAQYFTGGVLAGFTGSQEDGDTYGGYNKLGFNGGLFATYNFNKEWAMQMELKYTMKGMAKPTSKSDPSVLKMTLNYYELPLVLKYKFSKKLIAEAGFAYGILAKAKKRDSYGPLDVTDSFEKRDISSIMGIYYFLNEKLSLNLRSSYSLKPVSHYPGNLTFWGTYGQYNNVLCFSVYYTL